MCYVISKIGFCSKRLGRTDSHMIDVFPFLYPSTRTVPIEHAAGRECSHYRLASRARPLLSRKVEDWCWSLGAILKFPCFRFAVYDHPTSRRIGSQSSSRQYLMRQNISSMAYGIGSQCSVELMFLRP
jgi:hypothetical protein